MINTVYQPFTGIGMGNIILALIIFPNLVFSRKIPGINKTAILAFPKIKFFPGNQVIFGLQEKSSFNRVANRAVIVSYCYHESESVQIYQT